MSLTRLQMLEQFYQEDPSDPFNAYALAVEYRSVDAERAMHFFEELLSMHPSYLPTYYQAAQLAFDTGRHTQAQQLYEQGIALAAVQEQSKTLKELQGAYRQMLDELEE
jgi:tetratricopeptide (TPR) repeat protein